MFLVYNYKSENVCPLGCNYFDTVVANGVKQSNNNNNNNKFLSGIISAILFNVYMGDLSKALNSSGIGGGGGGGVLRSCFFKSLVLC